MNQNKTENPISQKSNRPFVRCRSWNNSKPIENISGKKSRLISCLPILKNKNFDVNVIQNTHNPSGKE